MDRRGNVVRRYAGAAVIAVAVALGLVGLDEVTAAAPAVATARAAPVTATSSTALEGRPAVSATR